MTDYYPFGAPEGIVRLVDWACEIHARHRQIGDPTPLWAIVEVANRLDALPDDDREELLKLCDKCMSRSVPQRQVLKQMVSYLIARSIPHRLAGVLEQISHKVPDPNRRGHEIRIGITREIASEVAGLTDDEIDKLVHLYVAVYKYDALWDRRDAICELLHHLGARAIEAIVGGIKAEEDHSGEKRQLVWLLCDIGEAALEALETVLHETDDPQTITQIADSLFLIGPQAVKAIALTLEHPNAAAANRILEWLEGNVSSQFSMSISTEFTHLLCDAVVGLLIGRGGTGPDRFNDEITARCIGALLALSPTLRPEVLKRLLESAFRSGPTERTRTVKVAARLDREEFLQGVRLLAAGDPQAASEIMYQLGHIESLPTQRRSLQHYSSQLKELEKRGLQRWDNTARRAKVDFWVRTVMTCMYFAISVAVISFAVWRFLSSESALQQAVGGLVGGLISIAGLLTKSWQLPAVAMGKSAAEQASLEMCLIGYMTRIGQIRLLFEQTYARGEMTLEELSSLQKMMADAEAQVARELAPRQGHD